MITPMTNKVLLVPRKDAAVSAGGIIKPHTARARDAVMLGDVVSVGKGRWVCSEGDVHELELPVKAGDTVLFNRIEGLVHKVGDVEHRILDINHVLCIVDTPMQMDVHDLVSVNA